MMFSRELKSLDQLMDGALVERFNENLGEVMRNVFDERTDPKKPRKISLVFQFRSNDRRDAASMSADVTIKTVAPKPLEQTVLMRMSDNGSVTLIEQTDQIPGQIDIDGGEAPIPRVLEFNPAETKKG